ncbi:MAG: SDR family NAD(P)-dependent oxidoreductase [Rickettsiales bacterium]|jgi:pteridine reductase|nr:SDR family NAD(P)-dependent oxidoreductase [Rickettsiales bacterium]
MTHTILITGCARRLGRKLALFLAKEKYNIAITYNKSQDEALSLQKELMALDVKSQIYQIDFNNLNRVEDLVLDVYRDFPDLLALINNASIFEEKSFSQAKQDDLMNNFNVHLFAPFFLMQTFSRVVNRGKIINITDLRVKTETLRFFPYLLSKKSLSNLTKMLSNELAPKIEVNEIRPGILLDNTKYDPKADINNQLTKRQNLEDFYMAVKDLLDNKYFGREIELDNLNNKNL